MKVTSLECDRLAQVVAVLADAFHDYPVMRFVIGDAGAAYRDRLEALLGYFSDSRLSRGWPVLGVEEEGELLAVALANPPESVPASPELKRRYERLCGTLGEAGVARFDAFADSEEPFVPEAPHHYLGMLGVRAAHQGRGLGRLLLDAVHAMSAAHPESTGVRLTTEREDNVGLYEHFGYRVLGRAELGQMTSWNMFRPNG